jgi:hypothetical protein
MTNSWWSEPHHKEPPPHSSGKGQRRSSGSTGDVFAEIWVNTIYFT